MFEKFTQTMWGSFTKEELKKFFGLALAAFFLIGAQWPVKLLKDSLLVSYLGAEYQPNVKIMAIFVCLPITILYTIMVEYFRRERIIYAIAIIYALLGAVFALALKAWSMGFIANIGVLSGAYYLYSESLTAISIAPFWSFVNDVTNPDEAKRGYGIIVFFAQLGGLVFTLLAKYIPNIINYFSECEGQAAFERSMPFITLTTSILFLLFMFSIWETVRTVKRSALVGYKAKGEKTEKPSKVSKFSMKNFLSGLALLATQPYVTGIFLLTAFQEISSSMMQYSMLKSVQGAFSSKLAVNNFMFDYGVWIQVVAVLFSLIGTSWFQRNVGIRGCLVGYPMFLLVILTTILYSPNVWLIAAMVALGKGLNYALNKPVREILYIPTSTDIKYRSKAWIEVFGSRAAKTFGSTLNKLSQGVQGLLGFSFVFVPLIWLGVAKAMGDRYHSSVKNKEKIG